MATEEEKNNQRRHKETLDSSKKNTQAIKQLTTRIEESIDTVGGIGGGGDGSGGGNIRTGVNRLDRAIKNLKESFEGNKTLELIKDPVGVIGSSIKGALKDITDIPKKIGESFKKTGTFFSKLFKGDDKKKKQDKLNNKFLKNIDRQTNDTTKILKQMHDAFLGGDYKLNNESSNNGEDLESNVKGPIQKLTELRNKSADAIKGFFMKKLGIDFLFRKVNEKFFKAQKSVGEKTADASEKISSFTEDAAIRLLYIQDFFKDKFENIIQGIKGGAQGVVQTGAAIISPKRIGRETAKALEKSEAKKDQQLREDKKDNKLFQTNLFEGLLGGLSKAIGLLSFKGLKGGIKESGFSLIEFFKKALGGGAVAIGAKLGGVGASIGAFFKAIGAGFIYMGANLPLFAKGAASLALIGASLIPFAGSLYLINQALEGFTFKKVGVFTAMLAATGAAIAGFALAVSSGIGLPIVAAAIGLLALAGAALIPFGYAIKLAGSGMEKAAGLFDNLGEVGWDKVSQAGDAIKDLASSFNKLAFGGLLDRITGGGFVGFVDNLGKFGREAGNVIALADAMDNLAKTVKPFQDMQFETNIGDLLKNISKYGEDFDSNAWWDVNMTKAADGLDKFLGTITTHLAANEGRQEVLEGMNRLLENTVSTGKFIGNADNMSAAQTGSVQFGESMNNIIAPVTNVQDNSQQNQSNVNIVNEQHVGPNTLSFISSYRGAQ
jgi:hypothetical protein